MTQDDLENRIGRLLVSIQERSCAVGRPGGVTLVAVSKSVESRRVREAAAAGQRVFGENRVQEATGKMDELRDHEPPLEWHLVGHLQTNKVRLAVGRFSVIESIDTSRLAREVNKWAGRMDVRQRVLLEVNVAGEASKSGFSPDDVLSEATGILELPHLQVVGLMTLAPLTPEPEDVRWVFRRLRETRDEIRRRGAPDTFRELSMGMTNDYLVAIEEGATMVRIGRALFGERPQDNGQAPAWS